MSLFLRICSLLVACSTTQAQGILFFEGTWQEAIDSAVKSNRAIFLDAYTTWCVPCKKMEKEVFPDAGVGAVFNERFVSIRVDMEKGEGLILAERYGVEAYPSLLFIDAFGGLLHRDVGFKTAAQLIGLAEMSGDSKRRISAWRERFDSGDRDTAFLRQYTFLLKGLYDRSYIEVAEAYLAAQTDWSGESQTDFIFHTSDAAEGKMFRYLVEHRAFFEARMGRDKIASHIDGVVQNYLTSTRPGTTIEGAQGLLRLVYPDRAERLTAAYPMTYYRLRGDREQYALAAMEYFGRYKDDAGELSEAARTFSQVIRNATWLEKAIGWARIAAKLEPHPDHLEVIALLYRQTGDTKKASKWLDKAIALARREGLPTDHLESLKTNQP